MVTTSDINEQIKKIDTLKQDKKNQAASFNDTARKLEDQPAGLSYAKSSFNLSQTILQNSIDAEIKELKSLQKRYLKEQIKKALETQLQPLLQEALANYELKDSDYVYEHSKLNYTFKGKASDATKEKTNECKDSLTNLQAKWKFDTEPFIGQNINIK